MGSGKVADVVEEKNGFGTCTVHEVGTGYRLVPLPHHGVHASDLPARQRNVRALWQVSFVQENSGRPVGRPDAA